MIIVIVAERQDKREESRKREREKYEGREKEERTRERRRGERERERERPPMCRFRTSLCEGSKGFRVHVQDAHMLNTCARFAGTNGGVLNLHTETF